MTLPTPAIIKRIAIKYGYEERREEASYTLFFKESQPQRQHHPILINVFYTTGGVMTKLSHPKRGYNELWRSNGYNSETALEEIFVNPRTHTGKGYRRTDEIGRAHV